jgi:short chain dehydrogenase
MLATFRTVGSNLTPLICPGGIVPHSTLTPADAEAPGTGGEVAPSAMITGATGGIGRAIAGRLAQAGYRLTLSGRDEAALAKLAGDLAGRGAESQVTPADMSSEDDIRAESSAASPRPRSRSATSTPR